VPKNFEPFFTTRAQGTGLGHAVVKRIVEEHRGRIFVDSATGRGTSFIIELPVDHEQAEGETAESKTA
jgi:signal transduction histidine kinase